MSNQGYHGLLLSRLVSGFKIPISRYKDTASHTDARITSGSDYELSRTWAEAIYLHPLKVDGIRYYSRHDCLGARSLAPDGGAGSHRNTQLCCGLFDRTSAHLREQNKGNIVDDNPELLADILERYDYALL